MSAALFAGCAAESERPVSTASSVDPISAVNPVTGEGLPNPEPNAYRELGDTARGTGMGIHRRPRHRPDGRTRLGVALRIRLGEGTKGYRVHKFSPDGELLMSLGTAGQPGNGPGQLNQPNDVIVAPDGSILVVDGHSDQNLTTDEQMNEAREAGLTGSIVKFSSDGEYLMEWGEIGTDHGQFRTHTPWSSTLRAGSGSRTGATTVSRSSTRCVFRGDAVADSAVKRSPILVQLDL